MPSAIQTDAFGLTGTVLENQYRVDAVVGEGGFGVVYRGRHLSLDQPIAIKVLKGLDGGDARINALVLEKFRSEARLLYTLSQSSLHIVRALDFGAANMPGGGWAPFMILEWLEGRSLAEDLEDRRRHGLRGRSVAEAFAILEPVIDGLAVAHRKQVAHRDIKPANIFLGESVKVLDFGIAKIMKEGESAGTKGTLASFTWLYAAPEQLDPRIGATGLATDVYGFGLLLTELLTDREPIDGRDVVGIMRTATNPTQRPTPRVRGANISDELEAVCNRALAVDPRARFPSIVELSQALASVRAVRPMTAMQPSVNFGVSGPMQPPPSFLLGTESPSSPRVTSPSFVGPPPGTPPPGQRPSGHSRPPPGYTPLPMSSPFQQPGYPPPPVNQAPLGPPPGTRPPGHHPLVRPFVRTDNSGSIIVPITIIFFVATLFLAATCAAIHSVL